LNVKIITYKSSDPLTPPSLRACAQILFPPSAKNRAKGKTYELGPIIFHGATEHECKTRAREWWDKQVAAYQSNSQGGRGKPRQTVITPAVAEQLEQELEIADGAAQA
jgi:hypothetical protein